MSEYKKRKATGVQDHLACFVPGMLVLGGMKGAKNVDKEAEQLLQTCTRLYREQKTGLAPERVRLYAIAYRHIVYFFARMTNTATVRFISKHRTTTRTHRRTTQLLQSTFFDQKQLRGIRHQT